MEINLLLTTLNATWKFVFLPEELHLIKSHLISSPNKCSQTPPKFEF